MAVEKLREAIKLIEECISDYEKEESAEGDSSAAPEVSGSAPSDDSKEMGFKKKPVKKTGMF